MLPYVVLRGAGVAIGRGKEALWAVGGSAGAAGSPRSGFACGGDRQLSDALKRNLGFVEVADGRVSRLHCIISVEQQPAGDSGSGTQHHACRALLEDCSSNGTFHNHTKLAKGERGASCDASRVTPKQWHCSPKAQPVLCLLPA